MSIAFNGKESNGSFVQGTQNFIRSFNNKESVLQPRASIRNHGKTTLRESLRVRDNKIKLQEQR